MEGAKLVTEQSNTHVLFPTIVQTTDLYDAGSLNRELRKGVRKLQKTLPNTKPDDWIGSVYTTLHADLDLLAVDPFTKLKPIILREICRYAETMHIHAPVDHLRILDAWLNVYERDASQEPHIHQNSVFSGIYYIAAPPGSSAVQFFSHEADQMVSPPVTAVDELNSTSAAFPAVEGQMIIFRSHLRHAVKPNNSDEERISFSFNVDIAD